MNGIKNDAGVINARYGTVAGLEGIFLFTHRDPKNGYMFAESKCVGGDDAPFFKGWWFRSELVKLLPE